MNHYIACIFCLVERMFETSLKYSIEDKMERGGSKVTLQCGVFLRDVLSSVN